MNSAYVHGCDPRENRRLRDQASTLVELLHSDTTYPAGSSELPFPPASFGHVFVCFVLEHLAQPVEAPRALKCVLKPGGTVTVIEGDHGSTYFHPDSDYARRAVHCQVVLQARAGGNALI